MSKETCFRDTDLRKFARSQVLLEPDVRAMARQSREQRDAAARSVRINSISMSSEAPQTTRQVVETVLLDPQERHKLVGFAHNRYGISSQEAEDLLQDTALELLRQRQYVQKPRAYVYAVFRARCSRHTASDRSPRTEDQTSEEARTRPGQVLR